MHRMESYMTQPAIWQSFTQGFLRRLPTMDWLLSIGIPMGLQFSITAIGTIIVQGAVNAFGSVYIAGFSAAGKIQNIVSTVFVTFGAAAATYVGQNRGAGRMDRVHQGVKSIQLMILVIHLFGDMLIRIFIDASETEVMDAASTYFRRHV